MTSTSTTCVSPPPTFNTLDPFQRARLVRSTRKIGRVFGTTPIFLDCPAATAPRETHSLDLNVNVNQLLPIGPHPHASGSGSRSRSATSSPTNIKRPAEKLKKAWATRRQGSLFDVPITLNPAANVSCSSFASVSSQASATSVRSLREVRGFSAARHRKADIPAPLVLEVNTVPPNKPYLTSGSPASTIETPDASQLVHRRPRSMSATLSADSSSSGTGLGVPTPTSTPLTPSFRFHAAAVPAHRRQKLQKLARTLGENIPPALVFPSYPYPEHAAPATLTPTPTPTPISQRPRPDPSSGATHANRSAVHTTAAAHRESILKTRESGRHRAAIGTTNNKLRALTALAFSPISVPIPGKHAKGASRSCWEPPAEWALGPSESESDVDVDVDAVVKQSLSDEDQDQDSVLGTWNADDYDLVMGRLRLLRS